MKVSDCYSAMGRGVAKIYSELVAQRLLYTMMPISKFGKKVKRGLFSQSGLHKTYFMCYCAVWAIFGSDTV